MTHSDLNNMQVWYVVFWSCVGISVIFPIMARKATMILWSHFGKTHSFGYEDNKEAGMCSSIFWYKTAIESVSCLVGLCCLKLGAGQYGVGVSCAKDALFCL